DEVDPAPHLRGDELVDRGVDRRVLAADPGAGEETAEEEVPGGEGEGGGDRRHEVEHEGPQEELLAAQPIRELSEEQRAAARTDDVHGAGDTALGGGDVQAAAVL